MSLVDALFNGGKLFQTEAKAFPALFDKIESTVCKLNPLLIHRPLGPNREELNLASSEIHSLTDFAGLYFRNFHEWGLTEDAKKIDNLSVILDSCSLASEWETKNPQFMGEIHAVIIHLNKLTDDLHAEQTKKVEQSTVEQLAKKVATLEEEVRKLKNDVRDLEGKQADKKAPIQKSGWFS